MVRSSAPLRRLGAELRRLREATGRTQADVGEAIGRSHTTLVNWERGKNKLSKSDLVCLLAELRVPADVRKGLELLRAEAGTGTSPWAVYGLPDWLRPLISFEEDATSVTTFQPVIIPGLLQTEDYARASHATAPQLAAPDNIERWVAARMRRQQRPRNDPHFRLHAVISEAALHLYVGGVAVMAEQLRQLVKATETDNITIRVLPSSRGDHAGVANNFTVLHFANPSADPPLGYFDGPLGGHMVSDAGDVAAMVTMFDDLRAAALAESESASLLAAILEEYQ
ncbi:helix-turn-helix domain-containing protein [Saccharomonospora iraqiensis]|uniref:helix-turn-helix domain-containing protein n=1 Tax=Saccharomonospora iraqiensis TaxID=52698 RepID=UPI00022E7568|nr:helix-turn-helix transcriptional regulator [Saccharomonospora iraqiensis]